jgi:hypothetical protein
MAACCELTIRVSQFSGSRPSSKAITCLPLQGLALPLAPSSGTIIVKGLHLWIMMGFSVIKKTKPKKLEELWKLESHIQE